MGNNDVSFVTPDSSEPKGVARRACKAAYLALGAHHGDNSRGGIRHGSEGAGVGRARVVQDGVVRE